VAAPPARLIAKGLLSLGTIVERLPLKYKYQLPLQRILGLTKGRGKLEKTGRAVLPVKWVFIYPLCSDFIARLNR
jgi:hypothetical protein